MASLCPFKSSRTLEFNTTLPPASGNTPGWPTRTMPEPLSVVSPSQLFAVFVRISRLLVVLPVTSRSVFVTGPEIAAATTAVLLSVTAMRDWPEPSRTPCVTLPSVTVSRRLKVPELISVIASLPVAPPNAVLVKLSTKRFWLPPLSSTHLPVKPVCPDEIWNRVLFAP